MKKIPVRFEQGQIIRRIHPNHLGVNQTRAVAKNFWESKIDFHLVKTKSEFDMADSIPIYRFLDCHAASKTLEAGKFRVGKLSKFNDPFEWRLGFTGISTPKEQIFAENFSTEHRRWLESWMGMLCFSDTVSDPVPWSLYADKHQGVAFEVVYPWKDNEILKMTYSKERPIWISTNCENCVSYMIKEKRTYTFCRFSMT